FGTTFVPVVPFLDAAPSDLMRTIEIAPRLRRRRRSLANRVIEVLEMRVLLADGIQLFPGPTLIGSPGVALNNVLVAYFTITDSSGNPSSKWFSKIDWGDGTVSKRGPNIPGPSGTFEFHGTHTYALPGVFSITVNAGDMTGIGSANVVHLAA